MKRNIKVFEFKNKIQLKQKRKKNLSSDENSNDYKIKYEKLKFLEDLSINIEEYMN